MLYILGRDLMVKVCWTVNHKFKFILVHGRWLQCCGCRTVAIINIAVNTPLAEVVILNTLGGEVDRLVANVAETSNNPGGYRVLMSSVNGSQLVNTSNPAAKVDYTISYDRRPRITLTRNDQEVKRVTNLTGLTTNNSEVRVTVNSQPSAPVGTYNDTVSISISAD